MKKEIKGENVTNKNLVTIKIKQRKEPITGLYVNHDNNWVAVLENTYDYVLDGYTFINREWIDHFHIETDRIADYIFSNSKWELINSTLLFPPALFDKEKLVEIWQHKAHKFWLGEVKNINEQYITMRILDKQAQWIEYKKFPLQKIRFFRVNTRYSCAYQKYIRQTPQKSPDWKSGKSRLITTMKYIKVWSFKKMKNGLFFTKVREILISTDIYLSIKISLNKKI